MDRKGTGTPAAASAQHPRRRRDGGRPIHLSLYAKAMLLIGASLAVITIVVTAWGIRQDRVTLTRELRDRLEKLAEQNAIAVSGALWNLNRDGARIVLDGVARDLDFLAATVFDERGRLFVHVGSNEVAGPETEASRAAIVTMDGGARREIGTLTLVFSVKRLVQARRAAVWRSLALGVIQLAAVLGAAAVMLRTVIRPLEDITDRMLGVADGVLDGAVPHTGRGDQVGDIAGAVEIFRVESERRRKAERELQQANDELERRVAERTRELSASEGRLRAVMDNVTDGIITIDTRGTIGTANRAALRIFGYATAELVGENVRMLMSEPERSRHDGYIAAYLRSGKGKILGAGAREVTGRHKDGSEFPLELAISEMWLGDERRFVGVVRNIVERKEAERKLQQSQKMDAVGQLTGGIAHDFNNLLTVILGNTEILVESLSDDADLRQLAETSMAAALRGADLTRSLLAFSRKQALRPVVTDINELVRRIDGLMRRTLGEHIDIEIAAAPALWAANVDPAQLEAAILNLAINARDAMPNGGKITIETANVELEQTYPQLAEGIAAGSYVLVAVADTGTGMTPEVKARAFEPFFTTKGPGKGTGLGLSMVYGFAKQSNGHVSIYSEVGLGTTVKLFIPRSTDDATPRTFDAPAAEIRGKGESVLVVEDDEMVRAYACRQIEDLGYRVLSARNGPEALDLLRGSAPVDLLFTDVVMPGGVNGPQLVAEARQRRPAVRVLFTSGYIERDMAQKWSLGPREALLAKPYQRSSLSAALRTALASPAAKA